MIGRLTLVSLSLLALGLIGCSSPSRPEGKPLPQITFEHLRQLPISVGMLQTTSDTQGLSDVFIVSPSESLRDYMHSRFVPKGFSGELRAVIEEARVDHSYEPPGNKVGVYFDMGGLDVYEMSTKIRLEYIGQDKRLIQGSLLSAKRVVKVSQHASIAERELRQLEGAEGLFQDIDLQVRTIVLDQMRLGIPLH